VEHLRIDSASAVTNPHAQLTRGIFEFELDALGSGMTKGVHQGLFPNAVDLLPDGWLQRLLPAGDADAKVDVGLKCEFLLNA